MTWTQEDVKDAIERMYGKPTTTPSSTPDAGVKRRDNPEERRVNRIMQVAKLTGWLAWHPLPAWTKKGYRTLGKGDKGIPDIPLLIRAALEPGNTSDVLAVEAKDDDKKLSPEQEAWKFVLERSPVEYWLVDSDEGENQLIERLKRV